MKKSVLFFLLCGSALAQVNHRYPRIGTQQWGGAPYEYYAKYDLIDIGILGGDALAPGIRALAPNAIIIPTSDWNAAAHLTPAPPSQWQLQQSDGTKLHLYSGDDFFYDLTEFCPRATVNGKPYRYNEYLPVWLTSGRINFNVYDGVATDGLWASPQTEAGNADIDIDRNGKNDWTEHGGEWIDAQFQRGIDSLLARTRRLLPPDKVILINSGGFHDWGWKYTNGIMVEDAHGLWGFDYMKSQYDDFMATAPMPHCILFMAQPTYDDPFAVHPSKNDYRLMRFMLCFTLLGDGYLNFEDVESFEHYYAKWYDEFDVDLGYPTGTAQEIRPGVWCRFFNLGAMILNGSGATTTVSLTDLQKKPGYAGPYFRFKGGQDAETNNGALFQDINLWGATIHPDPGNLALELIQGDGIILLKQPKEVIADIVIDDQDTGTSPGSPAAIFTGNWLPSCEGANQMYTVRCAEYLDFFGYTKPNGQNLSAKYAPNIGREGNYKIYEWHGYLGNNPNAVIEATDLKYTLFSTNGSQTVTVDQSKNYGRWNLFGEVHFKAGVTGYVNMAGTGNGPFMADAIKFVLVGGGRTDVTPPAAPRGLVILR